MKEFGAVEVWCCVKTPLKRSTKVPFKGSTRVPVEGPLKVLLKKNNQYV